MQKQYIRSERAHFMCPNMHFGMLVKLSAEYDSKKVKICFERLAEAHPFLRSLIEQEKESDRLFYAVSKQSQIRIEEREVVATLWEDYKEVGKNEWNVFKNGLLKVFIYPEKDRFTILFVAHHLLGDGRCLLELVSEFANAYKEEKFPSVVEEYLIRDIEDLPPNSDLTGISKYLVNSANKKWHKENYKVSYEEYASFTEQFAKDNPVAYETLAVPNRDLEKMKKVCKENEVSLNDLLMAKTYIMTGTTKIIIAADIRKQLSCYRKGAMGNYATAFGIVCKGKTTNLIEKAKQVHKQVQVHRSNHRKSMLVLSCYLNMDANLIDATAIASLGDFNSKAAQFVGQNMFGYLKRDGISITNLGKIENQNIEEAIFIPPASPAATLTIGVVTVNNCMQMCSSYYEKMVSKETIKRYLRELRDI